MKYKQSPSSFEKLKELIHNQALVTQAYSRNLTPRREIDEHEVRSTLHPDFWFWHNTLLRRARFEEHALSPQLLSDEELRVGNETIAHLGYVANADYCAVTGLEVATNVVSLSDYRQMAVGHTVVDSLHDQAQLSA